MEPKIYTSEKRKLPGADEGVSIKIPEFLREGKVIG